MKLIIYISDLHIEKNQIPVIMNIVIKKLKKKKLIKPINKSNIVEWFKEASPYISLLWQCIC